MAPRKSLKTVAPSKSEAVTKPRKKAAEVKTAAPAKPAAAKKNAKVAAPATAKAKTPKIPIPVKVVEADVAKPRKVGRPPKIKAPEPAALPVAEKLAEPTPIAKPAPKSTGSLTPLAAAILSAIQDGQAVEFIFADGETNPPRTFEPRQLIFDVFAKAWFVWGWDRRYNAERHHRVDLLAEVNDVEGVGRSAQGPYKEGTPANQIGGWLGGEAIPVKVVLLKQWIYAVKQAPAPFPGFLIEDMEEGKACVSFTGTDLRAIARWCMQFGDGIQVLEPQRLIDRIKQVGSLWAGKPKQEPLPVKPAAPAPQPKAQTSPHRHESRHESRSESRPEPRHEARHESRPEPRPEPARRPQRVESPKETRESETPKSKSGRIEIRIDRL